MSHAYQYLNINYSFPLPNSTFKYNNEISLEALNGILYFQISKYLPCDKQHYWNETSRFWGKILTLTACRDFGYRQWSVEAAV
jgi:hypothetical protein